jgi:hypothetical protein
VTSSVRRIIYTSSAAQFPLRVKLRRTQYEHMFSALRSKSDIARCSRHFAFVPIATIAFWVRASIARPHSWHSPTGGGTVHSIRNGRFDFMAPGIDVDQLATEDMRYF